MEKTVTQIPGAARLRDFVRVPAGDRVNVALGVVFLLAAAFYVWTAGTSDQLAFNSVEAHFDPYNELANAFLHFRLSVGAAPAGLVKLAEPYNPEQNSVFQGLDGGIHDFALYHGKLFLTWGPAPVIVLLVPLHLLGLQPTASITVSVFATVGLGFALATLRVVIRQIGEQPLWMCMLAALTLALSSAMPFILRRPAVYEEAISGGYCFAMAGIWLAISALARRRASLLRLVLMSLCIGLATASRPTLALTAVVLVFVYWSLRTVRPRRGLLVALIVPLGACVLLLMAYNEARFGSPLENGVTYQLAGIDQNTAPFGRVSYVPPGLWFYLLSLPRITILFPFLVLSPPPISYPGSLPAIYIHQLEPTGGLLTIAPIVVFLAALPWIWRRRPAALGRLAPPLLALVGAGVLCLLFLTYEFFSTTERYEVDFTTLLLLGAVASWLTLAHITDGWRRRVVRFGGGLLALWGCIVGLTISFTGYEYLLESRHPGTWRTLQDIGSPVSTALAIVAGRPVLAEVAFPTVISLGEQVNLVIVSPDTRTTVLRVEWAPVEKIDGRLKLASYASSAQVVGPGRTSSTYPIRAGGEGASISLHLHPGLNRVALLPDIAEASTGQPAAEPSQQLLSVRSLSLPSQ